MPKFTVYFCYTEYNKTIVEAETEKEAKEKIKNHLDEWGLDELKYSTNDREIYVD